MWALSAEGFDFDPILRNAQVGEITLYRLQEARCRGCSLGGVGPPLPNADRRAARVDDGVRLPLEDFAEQLARDAAAPHLLAGERHADLSGDGRSEEHTSELQS